MSPTRAAPVLLPALVLAALLAWPAASRADDPPPTTKAAHGDLGVRILRSDGRADDQLVAAVGSPFEVRYELRNRGHEPLLLPLGRPSFVMGSVRYSTASPRILIGGRAWGPAPLRNELTELAPGAMRIEAMAMTPSSHGIARVQISLVSHHVKVAEFGPVAHKINEHVQAVHFERKLVDEPRLWHGSLDVEAELEVVFTSHYGADFEIDARALSALWSRDTPLLDRLDTLSHLAVLDPSSRAVDTFRKGFGRRYDGPASPRLVRLECTKHLAIAAKKGYGWRGLQTLLEVAKDAEEDESIRRLALEGLVVALDERLRAKAGDCTFDLEILAAWRDEAALLFAALATQPSALGRRAKAILEARTKPAR